MMLADDTRSVVDVNDALADILARPRASLVGMSLDEIFGRYGDELREIVESAADSMRFSADVETADGIDRQVDLLIAAVDQRPDHVSHLVQVVDLTELREARRQWEDLLSAKDEFLAAVSHELRTPLTAVLGFAAVLVGQEPELSAIEKDELLRSVHRNSIDLANIVEDLLVAARAESNQVRVVPRPVELTGQVRELIDAMALGGHPAPEFHPTQVIASADPLRLRQIVRNLLTNTARFGGPEVVFELGSDGETVSLLVKDNGSGPSPEVAEHIFEPYVRTIDAVTTPRSIGLGLAVARHLAQLMDGDLRYRHEDGWTEFELRLPAAGGPPEQR